MKGTLAYLASDSLEGRGPGTKGIQLAGDFIANEFKNNGLKPLPGRTDYFQPFPFRLPPVASPETHVAFNGTALVLNTDFQPIPPTASKTFQGQVVFVGYGVTSASQKYDDYAGIDAKGKVVLALRYEPHTADGKSRFSENGFSGEASLIRKAQQAAAHGATGLIIVNPPRYHGADSMMAAGMARGGMLPVIQLTQKQADLLLAEAGAPNLSTLQSTIDTSGVPASRDLSAITATGEVKLDRKTTYLRNVIGVLPGTGPNADEYIVVGSHYDHLGMGGMGSLAPGVHAIHHGADDNASGSTAMLSLMRRFAAAGPQNRTMIFMGFSGEEEGLLGSQYFVANPPIDLKKIAYMVNMDMVGRLHSDAIGIGGNGTADVFAQVIKNADDHSPLTWKNIGRGGKGPSDHESFGSKRIPVLFFFTDLHADYHRPGDTWEKINFTGEQQIVNFAADCLDQLQTAPKAAYIDKFDGEAVQLGGPGSGPQADAVALNIMPDMAQGDNKGMKVAGVTANGAAAKAGIQAGDVLTKIGNQRIDNVEDLQTAYNQFKPGDKAKAVIERDGKTITVEVTFGRRASQN